MGTQYRRLKDKDLEFIQKQKLFYIASSSGDEVNLSPKGYDSIKILDNETLLFLDYAGSGNRTGRDVENDGNITLVFNAFEGDAKILRIFCKGRLIEKTDEEFNILFQNFEKSGILQHGVRRLVELNITAVETSCGMSVPIMEFKEERTALKDWAIKKELNGTLNDYIEKHHVPPKLTNLD